METVGKLLQSGSVGKSVVSLLTMVTEIKFQNENPGSGYSIMVPWLLKLPFRWDVKAKCNILCAAADMKLTFDNTGSCGVYTYIDIH